MQTAKKLGFLTLAAIVMATGGAVTLPNPAFAQVSHLTTPLMVLRFNQQRLHYQQALYNAVSQAVAAKNSVVFNLVGVSPTGGDAAGARQSVGVVVADMVKMGVPQNRIQVSYQDSGAVEGPEVHIFVQ